MEKVQALGERNCPNFISHDKEDEPEPKPQQVQASPSQNTHLGSELKNLATSYNQETTKELEWHRNRENLIMELSKSADAHKIAKFNKVNEEEPLFVKLKEKNGEMQSRQSSMT